MRCIHFLRMALGRKKAGRICSVVLAGGLMAMLTGCVSGGYYSDGIYYPSWYGAEYYELGVGAPGTEIVVVEPHGGNLAHNRGGQHSWTGRAIARSSGGVAHVGGGSHGAIAHGGGGFHGGGHSGGGGHR